MRRVFLFCTALLAFLAAGPGSTQDPAQEPLVVRYIRYRDTVPVGSPNTLVGLATSGTPENTREITVFVPPRAPDSLCINLISDNGNVKAGFSQRRPRYPGPHPITLPASLADSLREFGTPRIALLAHLSRTCSDDRRELIVPVGWGAGSSPHRLRLLLNPYTVARAEVTTSEAYPPAPCTRLRLARQLAYDYACEVDVSNFTGYRTLTVTRVPLTGPYRFSPVAIWVPDVRR
jgi:hypothetical protein